jgi:hypothetical protein
MSSGGAEGAKNQ